MITAIFNPGDKSITTKKVMQWDYGQVLSIKGLDLPKAVEIHFCVYTDSTTIPAVGITTDDHTDVEIPDGLLRQDRELRAYVYVADLEQGKTVRTVNIPIQRRQKPEIPHTPEDTEVFRGAIKAVNNSANRAETAANASEQNAKKTAEDRKAIEEMVETVSGIEQQVKDVKKYAGQAETAASNAALSEQKAKESETAALQAKADAETAKGSAETAAGKTAEDRTAVESAKEEVLQAKQQVSTDRAAVEAVERKVAQMGNAIPQAVLEGIQAVGSAGAAEKQGIVQAGTEQKSAVESTGTKTIEDINLAKKSATDAVETAKTDAVGAIGTAGAEQTQSVTTEGAKQVKAVENKGNEVLQSIPEDFVTQMESKLDKQQGAENAGKAMVINPEGVIVPGEVTGGDGIPIINTASGESPLVVSDSAERVNKGLSIIGNTVQNQDPPPSPDNLQEIKNFGKWNPETQKYEVEIIFNGDNLFNKNLLEGGSVSNYNGIECYLFKDNAQNFKYRARFGVNQRYTFTVRMFREQAHTAKKVTIKIVYTDGTIDTAILDHGALHTITTKENKTIEYISGNDSYSLATYIDLNASRLNYGIKDAGYREFEEQTLTLTSDRPITKWDKLVEQDGEIGWLYKAVFDSDVRPSRMDLFPSGFNIYKNHSNGVFTYRCYNAKKEIGWQTSVCKQFKNVNGSYDSGTLWNYSDHTAMTSMYFNSNIATLEAFVKWMEENPLEIVYKSKESEFVPLQQSEQDAIRALMTYYPTTVVTVDGGEVVPTVELTYTADTKNFILNREKVMQAQMLNIQSALISQKISGGGGIKVTDSSRLPVEEFAMSGKLEQVQTTGANLFDISKAKVNLSKLKTWAGAAFDTEFVMKTFKPNTKYFVKYKIKMIKAVTEKKLYDKSKSLLIYKEGGTSAAIMSEKKEMKDGEVITGSNIFITPPDLQDYKILAYTERYTEEDGTGVFFSEIAIEELIISEQDVPYEPYTGGKPSPRPDFPQPIETTPQGVITIDFTDGTNHQVIELNCPREFTKWDKLQKIDGAWYWVFGSKRTFLTENLQWTFANKDQNVYCSIVLDGSYGGKQSSLCRGFKNVNIAYDNSRKDELGIYCDHPTVGMEHKYFRRPNESIQTLEQWKTWLTENPIEILYKTKEPELIPLSMSEQDKLNTLTMYAPNTEITNTGGCNMELTYTVDTKSYVDSKILTLSKALL